VDFAHRAAHEATLLRRAEYNMATELAAPELPASNMAGMRWRAVSSW
jgi:hypothetical protein